MIEDKIDALIAALNANTEALLGRGQTALPLTADKPAKKEAPKKETAPAVDAPVTTDLSIEAFQKVGHAIIDARHAKNLEPANAPIKALATEYGVKKISEVSGTDKAGEVMSKLQVILKEAA